MVKGGLRCLICVTNGVCLQCLRGGLSVRQAECAVVAPTVAVLVVHAGVVCEVGSLFL